MYNYVKFINNPNNRNSFEQTPLHFTVRLGDLDVTNKLLQRGAEVNVVDIFGNTPLSLACIETPNIKILRLLLQYNADVNLERLDHLNLFLECVLNCRTKLQIEIITILIQRGVNINVTDNINNRNCMHIVATTGYVPLAELLLENGAILNIRDNFNYTPIELARCHQNTEMLRLFNNFISESMLM
ncbi:hypothetical protein NQ314_016968 [Rhamnusium bicolor]|uniref:Ankyrin repeat protein n=1 Tax=Rhamnusium bicolor TaxID=1586634 RepID=A0AAV8WVH0_9CUCU|nr:hypothetical protein NQ314_016968 [Rhamnusium bicolor]